MAVVILQNSTLGSAMVMSCSFIITSSVAGHSFPYKYLVIPSTHHQKDDQSQEDVYPPGSIMCGFWQKTYALR